MIGTADLLNMLEEYHIKNINNRLEIMEGIIESLQLKFTALILMAEGKYEELENKINGSKKEPKNEITDTERLDFIEKNGLNISERKICKTKDFNFMQWNLWGQLKYHKDNGDDLYFDFYDENLRNCIDKAIKEVKEKCEKCYFKPTTKGVYHCDCKCHKDKVYETQRTVQVERN